MVSSVQNSPYVPLIQPTSDQNPKLSLEDLQRFLDEVVKLPSWDPTKGPTVRDLLEEKDVYKIIKKVAQFYNSKISSSEMKACIKEALRKPPEGAPDKEVLIKAFEMANVASEKDKNIDDLFKSKSVQDFANNIIYHLLRLEESDLFIPLEPAMPTSLKSPTFIRCKA